MLSGTETVAVFLFNGGYPLEDLVVKIHGLGSDRHEVFVIHREIGELARGRTVSFEIPSYELPAPACDLAVTVISGKYGSGA